MMFKLFLAAVLLTVIAIALRTIWRLTKRVAHWVIRGLIAISLGMIAGATTQQFVVPTYPAFSTAVPWIGVLVAALTMLGMTVLQRSRAEIPLTTSTRHAAVQEEREPANSDLARPQRSGWKHVALYWSRQSRAARATALDDARRKEAWGKLEANADWAQSRVAVARRSCEAYLTASEGMLEIELAGFTVALRKRIPQIVSDAVLACEGMSASERRTIIDEAVSLLEELGAEADRKRSRITHEKQSSFAVTRVYVDGLTGRGQLFN